MSNPDIIQNTTPDYSVTHVFSMSDVSGGFDGVTYADTPSIIDLTTTQVTKEGVDLHPIDSEFGFYVTDFVGAEDKVRDGLYEEGWVGDLSGEGGEHIGLVVSDAPTDTFKAPATLGTWLAGLGGNSVKASTEHYSVMQNVLSDQMYPGDTSAVYQLDDDLRVIDMPNGVPGTLNDFYVKELTDALEVAIADADAGTPQTGLSMDFARDGTPELYDTGTIINPDTGVEVAAIDIGQNGTWDIYDHGLNGYGGEAGIQDILEPNESTIQYNIAYGDDYSVTVKDDGKLLYRWGNLIKRPNDVRLEVELPLPDEWSDIDPDTGLLPLYRVTNAELATSHTITNNPNDQIRPEDFENEAAIGVLPSMELDPTTGNLVSPSDFYAGDGTFYPTGTVLRDNSIPSLVATSLLADIGALSSDLVDGYTNAYYTTMDREPFTAIPDGSGGYVMGPRWRLQPDKYGQDLPGVVIPLDPSLPPPPTQDQVKYDVGEDTLTVINLLDWETSVSPLSISAGYQNNAGAVSINGLNMTSNFDVAFYVKGDIKPATLYNTELIMSYDQLLVIDENSPVFGYIDDDYLVGRGGNTFTGDAGADLFVMNYGLKPGEAFNPSTVNDFDAEDGDVVGMIGVGADNVELDTAMPDTNIGQSVVGGNLEITIDGQLFATLNGVTDKLDAESFFTSNQSAYSSTGTPNDDYLVGTEFADKIWAGVGNDTVMALGGDDTVGGGVGNDVIYGGEDNDIIYASAGLDTLFGEDGNDIIWAGTEADEASGGAGLDTIHGDTGDDLLSGGTEDDQLWGNAGSDTLNGDEGNDTLGGGLDGDELNGGADDDMIYGAAGNDTIDGGTGLDMIYGGADDDDITGGADADSFAFEVGFGNDVVNDYELGIDELQLDEDLWGGGLTETEVVNTYAAPVGGDVVFTFGLETITLVGLGSTAGLDADVLFI